MPALCGLLLSTLLPATPPPPPPPPPTADLLEAARLRFVLDPAATRAPLEEDAPPTPAPAPFGTMGTRRLNFYSGVASDVRDTTNRAALLAIGTSYFIDEDLSLDFELNSIYFDQVGRDAFGFNVTMLFRWHFLVRERWTLYMDGGAGLMVSTNDVPSDASSFNFAPQLGVGASLDIGSNQRLMTGIRWHHVSNANTLEWNPGRDSILLYAGFSVPF